MDKILIAMVTGYVFVNLLAFSFMLFDKVKSRQKEAERISEGLLFFMAAAFGSVGVYAGMFLFHHKTRKWYFLIGVPLLVFENIATLYFIYIFFANSFF